MPYTVTPWEVKGNIDYDKLIREFGVSKIDSNLKERMKKHAGKLHHLLRRDIFFAHRDMKFILDEYDKGNAYAQIAIGTDDVYKTAEAIKLFGGKITREPGPLPGISTKITACLDPDGWKSVFVDNIDFLKELE